MNALSKHWEKIVLGAVVLVVILVLAMSLLGQNAIREFSASADAENIKAELPSVSLPDIARIAAQPMPDTLKPNPFTHPGYVHSTANYDAVIPEWAEICPETGSPINYREDADQDGIPNKWEKQYGLNWKDPNDAARDNDNDGFTNLDEFKRESNPKDPTSPNVIALEYRLKDVYRPKRPIKLRVATVADNRITLQFQMMVDGRSRTLFQKPGDTISINNEKLYSIGAFEARTTNIFNKSTNSSLPRDISQVTMTDLKTGKEFTLVRDEDSLEDYVEAVIVRRSDGEEIKARIGTELPIAELKKTAVVEAIDETAKTVTGNIGKLTYMLSIEK